MGEKKRKTERERERETEKEREKGRETQSKFEDLASDLVRKMSSSDKVVVRVK